MYQNLKMKMLYASSKLVEVAIVVAFIVGVIGWWVNTIKAVYGLCYVVYSHTPAGFEEAISRLIMSALILPGCVLGWM